MEIESTRPKKLIRSLITGKLKAGEWENITDQDELNRLYAIKIREELAEIQESGHSFGRLALNNLNPNNPSNKLYFQ
jgi:hypothetical protein